jgi:MFS family permease
MAVISTSVMTLLPDQHHRALRRAVVASTVGATIALLDVVRRQPREIPLTAFSHMGEQAPFYILTAFFFAYGTGTLGLSRDLLLMALLAAALVSFLTIPLVGHLSDRIGRTRVYIAGALMTALFSFIYFAQLDSTVPALVALAVVLSLIPHGIMYGPQAAMIAECFTGRLRYSGSSLGYQLASVIAGGPAPLVATALFARFHSGYAIAIYILACGLVSAAAAAMLTDYTNTDVSQEYDARAT